MVIDQPMIVYKKDRRDANGNIKHTKKEMDDLWENWLKKKEREGSLVGKKIDFGEYMKGNI